jgi:hypothetical protein
VHIEIPSSHEGEDGGIESFSVVTWGQMNPVLLPQLSSGQNTLETRCEAWGDGASVDIGWIERGARAEHAFVGEDFVLSGSVVNNGAAPAGCAVSAYATSEETRVALGSWVAGDPVEPGEETSFELTCTPGNMESSHTLQSGEYDIVLEIDGAGTAWQATSRIRLPLLNRPDLVVLPELITTSSTRPRPAEEIEITVPVRNFCPTRNLLYLQGASSTPVEVALIEIRGTSRTPVQRVSIPGLPPGSATAAVFRWAAPPNPGRVSLEIAVDPDNLLRERDERNTATIQIDVTQ